jgi:lysophospholipase L1-like esterase
MRAGPALVIFLFSANRFYRAADLPASCRSVRARFAAASHPPQRPEFALHRPFGPLSIVPGGVVWSWGQGAVRGFGRLCGAGSFAARALLLCLVSSLLMLTGAISAPAAEVGNPSTIVVFGDSQAQGLAVGLQRVLVEDQRYRVLNRTHPGAALVHSESEWLAPVEKFIGREQADIAVVMFGANDRLDMRSDRGGSLRFRTDDWRQAYAAKVDRILTLLSKNGLRVVWCGNPIARSETYSADMSYINDIFAEETARFGAQFVPLWSVITDDQGRFIAYGKDRGGTTQRMRTDDGIHFTGAGYELIAEKIIGLLSTAAVNAR